MKIHLRDIPDQGGRLEGALSTKDYDLPLEDYGDWTSIAYAFTVEFMGQTCLIRGSLSTSFSAPCARCLEGLPWTIQIDKFSHSFKAEKEDVIDLTQPIREDILLSLPLAPRCELDPKQRCPKTGMYYGDKENEFEDLRKKDVWGALENLRKDKE